MLVSWTWLGQMVDLSEQTPEGVASILTQLGLEVEAIHTRSASLDSVVVVHVDRFARLEGSDRLKVATVSFGAQTFDVVCGAPNLAVGQLVACALPGTKMANGDLVREDVIRGVLSKGMLCSEKELGIGDDGAGLLVLDEKWAPGISLRAVMEADSATELHDVTIELSITPNRGDCLSHVGVAREVASKLGKPLRIVDPPSLSAVRSDYSVSIEDAEGCPRYSVAVLDGVIVGPSPTWLRNAVEACGARSINNIVDVTNIVLFELGQPLHAFDAAKLHGTSITARRGRAGESMLAIDHETYIVLEEDLVIADSKGPIAIAGVMGGAESEVDEGTTTVVIECAHFAPSRVRKTSKRLNLHSESSHRFERGVDPNGVHRALRRAVELIEKTGGGTLLHLEDAYPSPIEPRALELRVTRANQFLGTTMSHDEMLTILGGLGIQASVKEELISCEIPTFRFDLEREVDLIEELARCYGLDKIEPRLPEGRLAYAHTRRREPLIGKPPVNATIVPWRTLRRETGVRQRLCHTGFHESIHYAFTQPSYLSALGFTDEGRKEPIRIENPMSVEQSELRTSLIPEMVVAVGRNQAQQASGVALFEMANVFWRSGSEINEPTLLTLVAWGKPERHWSRARNEFDVFDLKGAIELLESQFGFGIRFADVKAEDAPYLHPGVRAGIYRGEVFLGAIGELHPRVLRAIHGVVGPIFVAELCVDPLFAEQEVLPTCKPLPRFPGSSRDIALLLDASVPFARIEQTIERVRPALLESWSLFDVFEGARIPDGKKSIGLALQYRDPLAFDAEGGKTLTDIEVNEAHNEVLNALVASIGAEQR